MTERKEQAAALREKQEAAAREGKASIEWYT